METEKLESIIECLEQSTTEEDILDNLMKIVRGFSVSQYKGIVLSNPYFKSLIPDIKTVIYEEIKFYRDSIKEEIEEIEKELNNSENKYADKLKSLKRDCVSLLYEIDQREKDLREL
jgi:gas vesicle protein